LQLLYVVVSVLLEHLDLVEQWAKEGEADRRVYGRGLQWLRQQAATGSDRLVRSDNAC
jgi:hypothetical protein